MKKYRKLTYHGIKVDDGILLVEPNERNGLFKPIAIRMSAINNLRKHKLTCDAGWDIFISKGYMDEIVVFSSKKQNDVNYIWRFINELLDTFQVNVQCSKLAK